MKNQHFFRITLTLCIILLSEVMYSFCGFFVAKADSKIFNKASAVIMVREGNKTTVTMSNDFSGDVKEFAMVVPVPVVLKRDQIDVSEASLFTMLDNYSAPRLAQYYESSPCQRYMYDKMSESADMAMPTSAMASLNKNEMAKTGVKIEAKYEVGEYDILILSAKESEGLKTWLLANGYKLPAGAEEVLQPYVASNMKFFVVKVNMSKFKATGFTNLRPLKISFDSPKFMLPIRLGMANADDFQDLIVYALSKTGRVETTNYQTLKMPTDMNVPGSVQSNFGPFYKALFDKQWEKQKNAAYLEYSWDLSGSNPIKCDPCNGPPPMVAEMKKAGVDWISFTGDQWNQQYVGDVFITRLHVRYDRENFPQDLVFQETSNKEKFQCRYVIHHTTPHADYMGEPCDELHGFYKTVYDRRIEEVSNYADLTGWETRGFYDYIVEYKNLKENEELRLIRLGKRDKIKRGAVGVGNDWTSNPFFALSGLLLLIGFGYWLSTRK